MYVCVFVVVCVHACARVKFKCVVAFMCICICVGVWVHVHVFGDSSVSRILHLQVIDINKPSSQRLSKEVLNIASESKKS